MQVASIPGASMLAFVLLEPWMVALSSLLRDWAQQRRASTLSKVMAARTPCLLLIWWIGAHDTRHDLNPCKCISERIAGFHGSQCGFCTPGMVVACHSALTKAHQKGQSPTPLEMEKSIDGNLCRCTGYRPILDACKASWRALLQGSCVLVR